MDKFFTTSNLISLGRIAAVPVFILFLLSTIAYKEYIAASIFILLSLTDALDGYLARKRKEITNVGRIIDPIADKILISSALIFLIGKGIDLWMALIIIVREVGITLLRIIALYKHIVISASSWGKAKTILQTIAIIAVILQFNFGWHLMVVAVLVTIISGIDYLIKARDLFKDFLNLPNLITLLRLLLIPIFLWFVFIGNIVRALIVLAAVIMSDKLDGVFARLQKQSTRFGGIFDATVDWALIVSSLITFLIIKKYLSLNWIIILLIPPALNLFIKPLYLRKNKKAPTSTTIGKVTVGFSYLMLIVLLLGFPYKSLFLTVAAILGYSTVINYLVKIKY